MKKRSTLRIVPLSRRLARWVDGRRSTVGVTVFMAALTAVFSLSTHLQISALGGNQPLVPVWSDTAQGKLIANGTERQVIIGPDMLTNDEILTSFQSLVSDAGDSNHAAVFYLDLTRGQIRAQKFEKYSDGIFAGDKLWGADGILVASGTGSQVRTGTNHTVIKAAGDGLGGYYVVWDGYSVGDPRIMVAHVNSAGTVTAGPTQAVASGGNCAPTGGAAALSREGDASSITVISSALRSVIRSDISLLDSERLHIASAGPALIQGVMISFLADDDLAVPFKTCVMRLKIDLTPGTGWPATGLVIDSSVTTTGSSLAPDLFGGGYIAFNTTSGVAASHVGVDGIVAPGCVGGTVVTTPTGASQGRQISQPAARPISASTPMITDDGVGGAIIAWDDARNDPSLNNWDIYGTRVTSSCAVSPGWAAAGTAFISGARDDRPIDIHSDGGGGAVFTSESTDLPSMVLAPAKLKAAIFIPSDITSARVGHVNSGGTVLSAVNGNAIYTATAVDQRRPVIVANGANYYVGFDIEPPSLLLRADGLHTASLSGSNRTCIQKLDSSVFPVAFASTSCGESLVRAPADPNLHIAAPAADAQRALDASLGVPHISGIIPWLDGALVAANRLESVSSKHDVRVQAATSGGFLAFPGASPSFTGSVVSGGAITPGAVSVVNNARPQESSRIVTLADGSTVVAWIDQRNNAFTGQDIMAQKFNEAGVPQWGAIAHIDGSLLSGATSIPIVEGTLAMPVPQTYYIGNSIVTCATKSPGALTGCGGVPAADDGTIIRQADITVTNDLGSQILKDLITDGTNIYVAWWGAGESSFFPYVQKLDSDGTKQWNPEGVELTNVAASTETNVRITTDSTGGIYGTWNQFSGPTQSVFVQRVLSNGALAPAFGPAGVAALTSPGDTDFVDPYIAADAAGPVNGAYIALSARGGLTNNNSSSTWVVQVDFSASVTDWIPADTSDDEFVQGLVSDGSGGIIVAWQRTPCDLCGGMTFDNRLHTAFVPSMDLFAMRFDAPAEPHAGWTPGGVPLSTAIGDQTLASLDRRAHTIVPNSDGGATFVWSSTFLGGAQLYGQRLDGDANKLWPTPGSPAADGVQITNDERGILYWEIAQNGSAAELALAYSTYGASGADVYVYDVCGMAEVCPSPPGPIPIEVAGGDIIWQSNVSHDTTNGFSHPKYEPSIAHGNSLSVSWSDIRTGNKDVYAQHLILPPTLTVIKHVVNDNGGSATTSSFTLHVKQDGTDVIDSPAAGAESPGTAYTLFAGTYVVSEDAHAGYTESFSSACDDSAIAATGTIQITGPDVIDLLIADRPGASFGNGLIDLVVDGDTVSNLDIVGAINAHHGPTFHLTASLGAPGVVLTNDVAGVAGNQPIIVDAGGASVSVTGMSGGVDAVTPGTVTLVNGQDKTCTITNDDIAPKLTVNKTVINDNGGAKTASDIVFHIDAGPGFSSGVQQTTTVGSHAITEVEPDGYAPEAWGGDCNATGHIVLSLGDVKTCTITNNDQPHAAGANPAAGPVCGNAACETGETVGSCPSDCVGSGTEAPPIHPPYGPSLFVPTPGMIDAVIRLDGNGPATRYAIQVTLPGGGPQYVQPDGTLGTNPAFQTRAEWGGDGGITIPGLPETGPVHVTVTVEVPPGHPPIDGAGADITPDHPTSPAEPPNPPRPGFPPTTPPGAVGPGTPGAAAPTLNPPIPGPSVPTGGAPSSALPVFSGTAPAGAVVDVVVDGSVLGSTTAGADGTWTLPTPPDNPLDPGAHLIYAIVDNTSSSDEEVYDATPPPPGTTPHITLYKSVMVTRSVRGALDISTVAILLVGGAVVVVTRGRRRRIAALVSGLILAFLLFARIAHGQSVAAPEGSLNPPPPPPAETGITPIANDNINTNIPTGGTPESTPTNRLAPQDTLGSGTFVGKDDGLGYAISITNDGDLTAYHVVVHDPLPPQIIYDAGSIILDGVPLTDAAGDEVETDGASYDPGTREITVHLRDPMAPGAVRIFSFKTTVDPSATTTIKNKANATYSDTN